MKQLLYITLLVAPAAHGLTASQTKVANAINQAARMVGVPQELLLSICTVESGLNKNAPTHLNDGIGVCQVKLTTANYVDKVYKHKHLATTQRLSVTYLNAFYAAKYLKLQLRRYGSDWALAADAFNKGHAVSSGSRYVQKVLAQLDAQRGGE